MRACKANLSTFAALFVSQSSRLGHSLGERLIKATPEIGAGTAAESPATFSIQKRLYSLSRGIIISVEGMLLVGCFV